MDDQRPEWKAETEKTDEDERSGLDRVMWQAKTWLSKETGQFRAFVNGLEWPNHWPRAMRWPALIIAGLGAATALGAAALLLLFKVAEPSMPLSGDLYSLNRPPALTFMDKNGQVAGVRGSIVGEKLALSEMPSYLPAAFLAMEDRRFYKHHGVDPRGLARAAIIDLKAGRIVQGGSTITQQVVKIVFLSPDRTFSRKLQEMAGAWALEDRLSKDQILELYLNRLYLGSGAYGIDGAAHVYFGKSARKVTAAEAAMLAALTRAPSAFSPRRDLTAAQARADKVLTALAESGVLSQAQVTEARAHPATVVDQSEDLARDYFLDAAAEEVKLHVPDSKGDLTVWTTMDAALQKTAREQVAAAMDRRAKTIHANQAALISMSPDGAVRALLGGRDYAESAFNRVTKAHRQPGSAFKTFVYLAALERGLAPYTVRIDQPITIKNWSPDNYNETYLGPVTLEQAYARSINTVAVELGLEVGIPSVISVARRMGIQSPLEPNASLALGTSEVTPLELTGAYATFASGGYRVQPYTVLEVRNSQGNVVYQRNPAPPARVIGDTELLSMNAMMYQVVQWGTGRGAAVPGHEVAGKTGTSAEYRDAWFIGFSPELVTGVWVGNDDFTPMKKVTGGSLSAQIWSGFMRVALKNSPPTPLPRAEPVAPQEPEIASNDSGESFLDQVGTFFGNLFGGSNANAAPPARRARTSNAETSQSFFPEENNQQSAAGSIGNSSIKGAASVINAHAANIPVPPPPQAALPPMPEDGTTRNLEEVRRAMQDARDRRITENNERYQREVEQYQREVENARAAAEADARRYAEDRDRYNRRYSSNGGDGRYASDRGYERGDVYRDEPPPMPRRYEPPPRRYDGMPMPRWEPPPTPSARYYPPDPAPPPYERDMPPMPGPGGPQYPDEGPR